MFEWFRIFYSTHKLNTGHNTFACLTKPITNCFRLHTKHIHRLYSGWLQCIWGISINLDLKSFICAFIQFSKCMPNVYVGMLFHCNFHWNHFRYTCHWNLIETFKWNNNKGIESKNRNAHREEREEDTHFQNCILFVQQYIYIQKKLEKCHLIISKIIRDAYVYREKEITQETPTIHYATYFPYLTIPKNFIQHLHYKPFWAFA